MKTQQKTQGLGPILIPTWLEINVARINYFQANFSPTLRVHPYHLVKKIS